MMNCQNEEEVPYPDEASSFEEYRYDALGRRILTRARQEFICPLPSCVRSVVRTVWDGDQVLYEISAPGATATGAIENDTGLAPPTLLNTYFGFGRGAYAHGLGIDDPLSLVRMEYSDSIPEPVRIVPTSNWAGCYDGGAGGRCITYGSQ